MNNKRSISIIKMLAGLMVTALVIYGMIVYQPIARLNPDNVYNRIWDNGVWQVEDYLKNNLKDPQSYESIDWGIVIEMPDYYFVHHKYRARNSFGGYVIAYRSFELNKEGEVVSVQDLSDLE